MRDLSQTKLLALTVTDDGRWDLNTKKMTDDDDEAGGRREKTLTAL